MRKKYKKRLQALDGRVGEYAPKKCQIMQISQKTWREQVFATQRHTFLHAIRHDKNTLFDNKLCIKLFSFARRFTPKKFKKSQKA